MAGKKGRVQGSFQDPNLWSTRTFAHVRPLEEAGIKTVFATWRFWAQESRPKGKELVELGSHTAAQCRRGKKIRVWPEKKKKKKRQ